MTSPRMKRTVGTAGVFGVLLGAALVVAPSSGAAPAQNGCDNRTNNTYQKLLECVRLDGVVEHMEKLQAIADANGGNRADQTSGYQASVDYVVKTLALRNPRDIAVCTLLDRPYRRLVDDLPMRYVGFTVPDQFFVGYGFHVDERYRGLPDIHVAE